MEAVDDQELRVKEDLASLTRALKPDDLNPDMMFSKTRGIRACTPQFGTTSKSSVSVSERLKRARPPTE
ncbi:MAG: hypothetical protein M0Q92_05930 [Methanoregula sp.]|jgi:hypothetical protein|nr:hypothetical protein [Methanoregula sp.]